MRRSAYLGMMAIMMASLDNENRSVPERINYIPKKEKKKVIPKGCKEYHFNQNGVVCDEKYSVWSCIASNEKTAVKKYKNKI